VVLLRVRQDILQNLPSLIVPFRLAHGDGPLQGGRHLVLELEVVGQHFSGVDSRNNMRRMSMEACSRSSVDAWSIRSYRTGRPQTLYMIAGPPIDQKAEIAEPLAGGLWQVFADSRLL
jgi:hypothetical protein